ncbi:hypothetical protein MKW98_019560, partial [Papaver atlanticum]
ASTIFCPTSQSYSPTSPSYPPSPIYSLSRSVIMLSLSIDSPKVVDVDPWDSISSLDDTHREEGINAGYKDGLVSGKEEGKQVGLKLGFEVGAELGREKSGAFRKAVAAMVKPAIDSIDLDLHFGTHPRLGVVDHICFHPLAQTSLEETVWLAKSVAPWLQSSRWPFNWRYLSNCIGYNNKENFDRAKKGTTQWVDNYSVPIFTNNIAAVIMALAHGEDIIEEACILSEPSKFTADQVQHGVKRLVVEEWDDCTKGYYRVFSGKDY